MSNSADKLNLHLEPKYKDLADLPTYKDREVTPAFLAKLANLPDIKHFPGIARRRGTIKSSHIFDSIPDNDGRNILERFLQMYLNQIHSQNITHLVFRFNAEKTEPNILYSVVSGLDKSKNLFSGMLSLLNSGLVDGIKEVYTLPGTDDSKNEYVFFLTPLFFSKLYNSEFIPEN